MRYARSSSSSVLAALLVGCTALSNESGSDSVRAAATRGRAPASTPAWPEFRGPGGQGHAHATALPTAFSETENVSWRTPIPGRGWSSPVIEDDRVWMTTAIETPLDPTEKARRIAGTTNSQPLEVAGALSLRAVCVDAASGKLLHDVEMLAHAEPQPIHELNSYASPTPVVDDGKLYGHFGTHGTACLDTRTLEVLWRNQDLRIQHENGPGSSPIVWGDLVIFHLDGSDVQYIVALDKQTGKVAWRTDRSGEMRENPQMRKAYGTPLVVEIHGRPQLISPASDWLYAYDPATGKELWKLPYGELGFSIAPRPVTADGLVLFCTSFMKSELIAVRHRDAKGPVEPRIAWRYGKQVSQMPSPIVVGEEVYFVSDKTGIVTCLDVQTGTEIWTERVGGNFSASPIFADGKLWFANREGVVTVLRPGRTFEKIAESRLDGRFFASPAAVGSALFLRSDRALYRIATDPPLVPTLVR